MCGRIGLAPGDLGAASASSLNEVGSTHAPGQTLRMHLVLMDGNVLAKVDLTPDATLRMLHAQAMKLMGGQHCQLSRQGQMLARSDEQLVEAGLCNDCEICVILGQPLLEGLALWLRADDLEPGPVKYWRDARGEHEVSQATPGLQPVLIPDALGPHSVVRFGQTGPTFLTVGAADAKMPEIVLEHGITVVAVVASLGTPSPQTGAVIDPDNFTTDAHEAFLFDVGEVNPSGFGFGAANMGAGFVKFSAHSPTSVGGKHIKPLLRNASGSGMHTIAYRLQFDAEMRLTWDGKNVGGAAVNITQSQHLCGTPQHPLTIGAMSKDPASSARKRERRFVGDVAEMLVYGTALSQEDMAGLELYFKRRFADTTGDKEPHPSPAAPSG